MTQTETPTEIQAYADRIRTAYRQLAEAGEWVSLTELRPMVGGHRPHVDAALRHMSRSQAANLAGAANQRHLTRWDRDAALPLGGDPQHMINIR